MRAIAQLVEQRTDIVYKLALCPRFDSWWHHIKELLVKSDSFFVYTWLTRSGGILPPQQAITQIEFYNDILCFEHELHKFYEYRLGAAAAGYHRYGKEQRTVIVFNS